MIPTRIDIPFIVAVMCIRAETYVSNLFAVQVISARLASIEILFGVAPNTIVARPIDVVRII